MIRPGKNLRARLPLWFAPSLAVLLGFGGILRITFAQHMQRPVVAGRLIAMYAAVGLSGVIILLVRAVRGSPEERA